MNKLVTVAVAMLIASPAFAQSYTPSVGSGNIAPSLSRPAASPMHNRTGSAAFAAEFKVRQFARPFAGAENAPFERAKRTPQLY
jgi:hypothetical protein